MDIKPTRSELMKLKNRIKLARSGHKLLKKKRDGLILEFFEVLKRIRSIRKELAAKYKDAHSKVDMARVMDSDLELHSLALAIKDQPEVTVTTKNIMGVVVPKIDSSIQKKKLMDRGYGLMSPSIPAMEATSAYEELLEYILLAAEVETSLKRLLSEIDRTKRRVNALEFEVIPKLMRVKSFIELRLEEQERETIFRTKRIKNKN